MNFRRLLGLSPVVLGFVSCGPTFMEKDADTKLISLTPQEDVEFMVIRLKEEPLLRSASNVKGRIVIDAKKQDKVLREQEKLEKELKAISKEIRIVYKYKWTFNGFAISVPKADLEKVKNIPFISGAQKAEAFLPPESLEKKSMVPSSQGNLEETSSVKFMGAHELHQKGITGKGVKVGIIDTGIDYTHAMFGGSGNPEDYLQNDPLVLKPGSFPVGNVRGGYDFVGSTYGDEGFHIPIPDENPLDEQGHGTHVAGTVAGKGDGVHSYNGVAPDAELYALKVFGKGLTSDTVVMAAFEYAVDPNNDGNLEDKLDVLNLSLGGKYGNKYNYYNEAIENIARAGIITVLAAGNDRNVPYITGSPGASTEAGLSVAASTDAQPHNWIFPALSIISGSESFNVLMLPANFTCNVENCNNVEESLVYVGTAQEITEEQASALQGKVALVDRGVIGFADKAKNVLQHGAIGLVVANHVAGEPLVMGGMEGHISIPAVMVSKADGDKIKAAMKIAPVSVSFNSKAVVERPDLIDLITEFSSRGPRSFDALIKPEIAAPGLQIVSAMMGGGKETERMNGTSMASPHVAGAAALLKQVYPWIDVYETKSRMMNSARILRLKDTFEDVARQGAGRIQIDKAVDLRSITFPSSLSLGVQSFIQKQTFSRKVTLENRDAQSQYYRISGEFQKGMRLLNPSSLELKPYEKREITLRFEVDSQVETSKDYEKQGFVLISSEKDQLNIPVLMVFSERSYIRKFEFPFGKEVSFTNGPKATVGEIWDFNLLQDHSFDLGRTFKKNKQNHEINPCEVVSSGYRMVNIPAEDGSMIPNLQFAFKLVNPVLDWNSCEPSVLIDQDGDGKAEQELWGHVANKYSFLLNAKYVSENSNDIAKGVKKLDDGIIDGGNLVMKPRSPLAVLEVPVSSLALTSQGKLSVKIGMDAHAQENLQFLGDWTTIDLSSEEFFENRGAYVLNKNETIKFKKNGKKKVYYMPQNHMTDLFDFASSQEIVR